MSGSTLPPEAPPALRPSEYTAALVRALRGSQWRIRGVHALEIGSGSGIVLAMLGGAGAASLTGVDIEEEAVAAGARLLDGLGYGAIAEFHLGDMWLPVAGRRFDLIVANLPHFPMEPAEIAGRRSSWSSGGRDGRWLLDSFLEGLGIHLAPGGRAVITHNGFVGLDRSREIVRRHGLAIEVVLSTTIYLASEKVDRMTNSVLCAEYGRTIHRYGPYSFADMHIVEIAQPSGAT